ncbi:MAG: sialidase family protein, partial [Phycisphaerales bacterium]|nr:sialidase family protein [Phycisphaerales bacterium]
PDGEVYVAGRSYFTNTTFLVAKSTTVRNSGSPLAFDFSVPVELGGVHPYFLGTGPNPGGLHGNVWVAADHSSSATRGYVHLLASVDPPGSDPMDVHVVRSADGGQTWSSPVRVNDDPVGANAWQWFATMDVAPNGRIDVVWNDTRNDPGGVLSQLYYSYSTDAGVSWSVNVPVGPMFDPLIGWPNQNKIGDYYDIKSDLVGANVAYAATYNGEQDVYYLRIGQYDCNNNGIGDTTEIAGGASDANSNGIPDACELEMIPATSTSGLLVLAAALVIAGALLGARRRIAF